MRVSDTLTLHAGPEHVLNYGLEVTRVIYGDPLPHKPHQKFRKGNPTYFFMTTPTDDRPWVKQRLILRISEHRMLEQPGRIPYFLVGFYPDTGEQIKVYAGDQLDNLMSWVMTNSIGGRRGTKRTELEGQVGHLHPGPVHAHSCSDSEDEGPGGAVSQKEELEQRTAILFRRGRSEGG